ncbi:MAG TPA: FecR domain-containing protein [Polyangia bacterium]|nr:FecR domain-containing protein [Polyangia bacterium]
MSDERWLETSESPGAQALRQALDESERHSHSELMQRRVWARVSDPRRTARATRHAFLRGALAATAFASVLLVGATRFHVLTTIGHAPVASTESAHTAPQIDPIAQPPTATPGSIVETRAGERLVRVLPRGARAELAPLTTVALDGDGRPELRKGEVRFSVAAPSTNAQNSNAPKFLVTVASYHVVVASSRFDVSRFVVKSQAQTVTVTVEDGLAEIEDNGRVVRIGSGETWSSVAGGTHAHHAAKPTRVATPTPMEGPSVAGEQDRQDLAAARAATDPLLALSLYEKLATRGGAVAENAMYEIGGLYHDRLTQPAKAVAAWDRYRTRYPNGLLRAEADLSVIDTLVSLGDEKRTLGEALAFLKRYPHSERRGEIARVVGDLYRGGGKCGAALEFYRVAQGATVGADDADDAAFGQAACLYSMRDEGADAALRGYLDTNPRGRHARDAARLLGDKHTP